MTQIGSPIATQRPETPRRISYEEFLNLPHENEHVEWVNGEVVDMPPISDEHQEVALFLLRLLTEFVEIRRLGKVRYEPFQMKTAIDLPGRAPDILFVSNANLQRVKKLHVEGPADLVVEVISPDSRGRDRGEKYYEYEKGGVREYWLIDPIRKQAEFYLLDSAGVYGLAPIGKDGTFRSSVLEGFWLKVEWMWQSPPDLRDIVRMWEV